MLLEGCDRMVGQRGLGIVNDSEEIKNFFYEFFWQINLPRGIKFGN